ncbi:hypothetical protein [Aristophania vespae]|uniref:hypothetical protein n=1 Tax=Aristophania vespae TaxID=2697033 RepID=UPI002351B889|nr:hypothetical protein [Aristophania vespae]UMM63107.1 hypothetical protein DM15PD_00610 [Aristophania vespae]
MINGHGGARRGAGRPRGGKNAPKINYDEASKKIEIDFTKKDQYSPLDFLKAVVNTEALPLGARIDAAAKAAPYCHAKPNASKPEEDSPQVGKADDPFARLGSYYS